MKKAFWLTTSALLVIFVFDFLAGSSKPTLLDATMSDSAAIFSSKYEPEVTVDVRNDGSGGTVYVRCTLQTSDKQHSFEEEISFHLDEGVEQKKKIIYPNTKLDEQKVYIGCRVLGDSIFSKIMWIIS